ncbi:MAG TPA: oligopeptide/dipeptide ABC transporter ATP-binding protein, partial [Variovorax sp.]
HIADTVMVMYLGKSVEYGPKDAVFNRPAHPYTRALLASTPRLDPKARRERSVLKGELPSPLAPPPGCVFNTRCAHATERCLGERPLPRLLDERMVACHHAEQFLTDSKPSAIARPLT